jgi:hypothetical protein
VLGAAAPAWLGLRASRVAADEIPGFEVNFEAVAVGPSFWAAGTEHEFMAFGLEDDAGRDNVPGVFGDDVGGEEIDVAGGVTRASLVGAEVALIAVAQAVAGGFDLDAEIAASVLDADVVGGGVPPRFGDLEAVTDGLRHELEFDPLAAHFEIFEAFALCHVPAVLPKEKAQPVGRA